jgi:hypothetical protein
VKPEIFPTADDVDTLGQQRIDEGDVGKIRIHHPQGRIVEILPQLEEQGMNAVPD